MPCQEHLGEVLAERARLGTLGAEVLLVSFSAPALVRAFVERLAVPCPVLCDPGRQLYAALGLGRAPWWRIWSPVVILRYLVLLARGRKMRPLEDDAFQLGGDFVTGPDGRLAWIFRQRHPAHRPSAAEVLRRAEAAAGRIQER